MSRQQLLSFSWEKGFIGQVGPRVRQLPSRRDHVQLNTGGIAVLLIQNLQKL